MGLFRDVVEERKLYGDLSNECIAKLLSSRDFSIHGFSILHFERRFNGDHYTFTVPVQDIRKWYETNGDSNLPIKTKIEQGTAIAQGFGLALVCPPDFYIGDKKVIKNQKHHLEFRLPNDTHYTVIASVHPRYLSMIDPLPEKPIDTDSLFDRLIGLYDI
ncbi:MAG: hypothetical protein Q8N99_05285 [Nanoarchaeota archaeon]|nr:hypothetical protein [Nanoarchaeota archaeon]